MTYATSAATGNGRDNGTRGDLGAQRQSHWAIHVCLAIGAEGLTHRHDGGGNGDTGSWKFVSCQGVM